ncbi:MAG: nodulation protein NfeD [Verrucomicrobiota bacterium]|nr:nodulation protein NfeD [Verrucomicrobiota bacterium]
MKRLGFFTVAGWLLGAAPVAAAQVGLINIDGAIGPATAHYISRAIDVAAAQHDQCLVIEMDTPGGLLDSTKEIVETFYSSQVPTVVYVAPSGASAGSAGVFITLAADVAAMAPHTSIGAAHPVEMGLGGITGGDSTNDVMRQKLENYASAFVETIADKRHRNVEWAKSAVVESKATTAEKALQLKVIDLIATNVPDLLQQLNGRSVDGKILKTAGASVVEIPMILSERFFQLFWQPEVMMILMLIAIYGIIAELSHPGAILPGVAGAVALILLLYMSATLPLNIAGVALILLAVALFIMDIFAPTHGVLTTGGIISFFLGALMLFNHAAPGYNLPMTWIIPATVVTAAFFVFFVSKGIRAQFLPVKSGKETMIGRTVNAQSQIGPAGGRVFVEGEIWNAVSETPVEAGQPVEITGIEGLTLKVKPSNR